MVIEGFPFLRSEFGGIQPPTPQLSFSSSLDSSAGRALRLEVVLWRIRLLLHLLLAVVLESSRKLGGRSQRRPGASEGPVAAAPRRLGHQSVSQVRKSRR